MNSLHFGSQKNIESECDWSWLHAPARVVPGRHVKKYLVTYLVYYDKVYHNFVSTRRHPNHSSFLTKPSDLATNVTCTQIVVCYNTTLLRLDMDSRASCSIRSMMSCAGSIDAISPTPCPLYTQPILGRLFSSAWFNSSTRVGQRSDFNSASNRGIAVSHVFVVEFRSVPEESNGNGHLVSRWKLLIVSKTLVRTTSSQLLAFTKVFL